MQCEMEGGAIAQVCCSWHVPFVIVRVLSDLAGSDSHVEFDEFIEDSSVKAAQDSQVEVLTCIGCLEMMIREFKDTPFELNHQEVLILDGELFRVYPDMPGLHVMDTYYVRS